jgi:hypothetical protein
MIRITWALPSGAGFADVLTVDAAVDALDAALRAATHHLGPDAQADILYAHMAPLRMAMVTEGAAAIERGREWESPAGEILVRMLPNSEVQP